MPTVQATKQGTEGGWGLQAPLSQ